MNLTCLLEIISSKSVITASAPETCLHRYAQNARWWNYLPHKVTSASDQFILWEAPQETDNLLLQMNLIHLLEILSESVTTASHLKPVCCTDKRSNRNVVKLSPEQQSNICIWPIYWKAFRNLLIIQRHQLQYNSILLDIILYYYILYY